MKRKVHIFLGAPPPSLTLLHETETRSDGENSLQKPERPIECWRHLDLCWRDGQLTPAEVDRSREVSQDQKLCTSSEIDHAQETKATIVGELETDNPHSMSLHEFSCLSAAQKEPDTLQGPGDPPLSMETHYLTTWTLSQALALRANHLGQSLHSQEKASPTGSLNSLVQSGGPQLLDLHISTPSPSKDLCSPIHSTPSAKYRGIILTATPDGVLCSQESTDSPNRFCSDPSQRTPTLSMPCRSPEVWEESQSLTKIQSMLPILTNGHHNNPPTSSTPLEYCTAWAGPQSRPTLLEQCSQPGMRVAVLVVAVHPCFLKEVLVKSGPFAGSRVPLATILVTDQSAVEMKVVLWRQAAFYAVTISPGDALFITGLCVHADRWQSELVLQSTFRCKLLHLGQITGPTPPKVSQQVHSERLESLCEFVSRCRPLLASLPHRSLQGRSSLHYTSLRSLKVNTLVHAVLKVTHTQMCPQWHAEAESTSRAALKRCAVVTVQQADGQQGALLLWNSAVDWISQFNRSKGTVWDLQVLLVRASLTSDLLELHSTPWSLLRALDPADRRALDFHRPLMAGGECLELDVDTLLSQKFSGEVMLTVQLLSFTFLHSYNAPQPILDYSTPLDVAMELLNGDVTYVGCGRCSAELVTDGNHIYKPCYLCLPYRAVRCYYRPSMLTVKGRDQTQVCLKVPPEVLEQILQVHPDMLQQGSAPDSSVKNLQVAAQKLLSLMSLPRRSFTLTVRSCFRTDQHSMSISQELTLLCLSTV